MDDIRGWLRKNSALKNYDDPEIDPDKVVCRHRKAVASARSALREHLQLQLRSALKNFYSDDIPEEKFLIS
ncbi:MAG TPA: hypothetical protein DCG57_10075 [Candidatus Riflebacteria bacterium]|jgi:hypothetical protein|nr:MAG: hypothetical protein CVV41_07310 [Candidatus Riflebacteria bacterium HGW-Riflebacteria-1]HAE38968.1 hypothetical protein [Candidatus Riflebacteria bacterium]